MKRPHPESRKQCQRCRIFGGEIMINTARSVFGFGALALSALASMPTNAENVGHVVALQPGDTVPLDIVPAGVFLRVPNDPGDEIWNRLPEYGVELLPAPAVHPSVALRQGDALGDPLPLYFSVASDRERLYVKLRWNDDSRDVETRSNRFRDGVAIQFALTDGDATSHMMGGPQNPVNIWYWRSDRNQAENLAAAGFGSTTLLAEQVVSANAAYVMARQAEGNEWTVVLSRPLAAAGEHTATFEAGLTQAVAFAVWDGSEKQRDGHKRASSGWIHVDLASLAGG